MFSPNSRTAEARRYTADQGRLCPNRVNALNRYAIVARCSASAKASDVRAQVFCAISELARAKGWPQNRSMKCPQVAGGESSVKATEEVVLFLLRPTPNHAKHAKNDVATAPNATKIP